MTDRQLLDRFVQERSHEAFEAIVQRHVGMVYNAAVRQVRQPVLAEDICQAVFMILAQKAACLCAQVILPGWLIRTTFLASRDALKMETRRKKHEQRYAAMSPTYAESPNVFAQDLSPEIDRALSHLSDADRGAIVLRYIQGEPMAQVAAALSVSEQTASKRLQRALDRLRDYFARHPITPSIIALSAAMEQLPRAVHSSVLAQSTSSAALAGNSTGQTTMIAKSVLKTIMWSKAKIAAAVAVAALLTAVGTVSLVHAQNPLPAPAPSAVPVAASAATGSPQIGLGHLANGVSIELLGISVHPSTDKSWWRADGSAQSNPPAPRFSGRMSVSGDTNTQVVVRINNKLDNNPDPATVNWWLEPTHAWMSENSVPADSSIESRLVNVHRGDKEKLTAQIAAGPWNTLLHAGVYGQSGSQMVNGMQCTYTVSGGLESRGKTYFLIAYVMGKSQKNAEDSRLVVIDNAGQQHVCMTGGASSAGSAASGSFSTDVPLGNIKQIQFQTRPFDQWIEIRNICTDPAHPTSPVVVTSDDEKNGL